LDNPASTEIILGHIISHAKEYFPELEGRDISVSIITQEHREYSSLYRIQVKDSVKTQKLFVKSFPQNTESKPSITLSTRARLAPAGNNKRQRTWLEYTALKAIDDHFTALDNPNLGSIRILDFIKNPQTIVMEETTLPDLRHIFFKHSSWRNFIGRPVEYLDTFYNAGAWLREYSSIAKYENVTTRHEKSREFLETFSELVSYVKNECGKKAFFDWVEDIALAAGARHLPTDLPLGLGHGDYAMRNILVKPDGGVISFDTAAKWRTPIYEDIAYFLTRLETNRLQIFSFGLAVRAPVIHSCQEAFLSGYFQNNAVPIESLRLYQVSVLLDSWSAQLDNRNRGRHGVNGLYDKVYLAILGRHYQTMIKRLLNSLS
jgi:hypothetical protein